MFENAKYIKPDVPFVRDESAPSPLFRKRFFLENLPEKAVLSAAGLGIGYFYINGKKVSDDMFTSPVSEYNKTVWYTSHDATALLKKGENVIAAELGNGMFNESFETCWNHHTSVWRDNPKMILQLDIDNSTAVVSDDSFVFSVDSPVIYNELRHGEHYDSRKFKPGWNDVAFDDSDWRNAVIDTNQPKGVFRECVCEPIRECQEFKPVSITQSGENKYIYDFGQNMSGFVRLSVNQPSGDKLTIRYAEYLTKDGGIIRPNYSHWYKQTTDLVQRDDFICCGKEFTWSPKFTYHGFRFVEIEGLRKPCDATAVFVHQDVQRRSEFECSNEDFNRLFKCGIMATWSNMFYMPTDCPTREKLGWCNDAQSSTEQFLTNFKATKFFEKWLQDIHDAMRDDGALPGVIPTHGWGYDWGHGPVSEGILFEIPYRLWLHTGNKKFLADSIPYFDRYFSFLDKKTEECGLVYGLEDWASPSVDRVTNPFINRALQIKFYKIAVLAANVLGRDATKYEARIAELSKAFKQQFIDRQGRCVVNKQTAVALCIWLSLYDELEPLKQQFIELINLADFHHDCGMLGIRYLFEALEICGLQELAYKILTAKNLPSYIDWLENGATTLYEFWDMHDSRNHHMNSDFMSFLMKTAAGIIETFEKITVNPYYYEDLTFARGKIDDVEVKWQRQNDKIELIITVPDKRTVEYKNEVLSAGTHKYIIER